MTLEEITNYLISNPIYLPVKTKIGSAYYIIDKPYSEVTFEKLDLRDYAKGMFYYTTALQKEIVDLKNTLKNLAEDNFNIHWSRNHKAALLEKYFPDLKKRLPYYAGGGDK